MVRIFLIFLFSLIALHFKNVFTIILERREQVPFSMAMKMGTQTRVFSRTLARGNSKKCKDLVFYGQEPPGGESTTTECGFNYQLLAVMY